jgi:hypothetical protein
VCVFTLLLLPATMPVCLFVSTAPASPLVLLPPQAWLRAAVRAPRRAPGVARNASWARLAEEGGEGGLRRGTTTTQIL